jgi:signal transduction histidine kinase
MASTPYETVLTAYLRNTAPLLFFELGGDLRVRAANPFSSRLVGRDAVGLHFREVVVDFAEELDPHELGLAPDRIHRLRISTRSRVPQDFACSFMAVGSGVIVVGTVDAEEQAAFQSQLLSVNRQLANLTRELQKSNVELAHLNQLKNQFLGMATHDLRNPVGAIMSLAEFVLEEAGGTLAAEHVGFLEQIVASSRHMNSIIADFLDISMIEAGGLNLEWQSVELAAVVGRVLALASARASKKGIGLEVALDPSVSSLMADPGKLEQVLTNLVVNAIEHSFPGSSVVVRSRLEGSRVALEVEDHGVGIPREMLDRLFNPFERKRARKTAGEQSTGLGLVIARKVVEAHDGTITVTSEVGRGTLFTVTLPITRDEG